jgi:predicted ArsR family transcriptional regulator
MKKDGVETGSPFVRESETHEKIHSYLKAHPRGLTTQDIEGQTNISRKAVEKHLQILLFSNDIYMKQVGSARIYYPNHRYHHLDFQYFDIGKKRFYIDLIENDYGKSILVQQKIKEVDKWITKGSVFIPLDAGEEFLKNLKNILNSKKLKEEIKNG